MKYLRMDSQNIVFLDKSNLFCVVLCLIQAKNVHFSIEEKLSYAMLY